MPGRYRPHVRSRTARIAFSLALACVIHPSPDKLSLTPPTDSSSSVHAIPSCPSSFLPSFRGRDHDLTISGLRMRFSHDVLNQYQCHSLVPIFHVSHSYSVSCQVICVATDDRVESICIIITQLQVTSCSFLNESVTIFLVWNGESAVPSSSSDHQSYRYVRTRPGSYGEVSP